MADKILFCATVDYHFKAFHLPYMKWFQEQGWEVDVAASGNIDLPFTDNKYHIDIQRSPFHGSNILAYKQLKRVIDQNNYSIIHCHTPLGGVLARLAARGVRKKGTKVIYTAHGFHFCKGASYMNWLIYYPIERYLSRHTDRLITINEEDFRLAKTHNFKAGSIVRIHGVGVDTERFKPIDNTEKLERKKSFGYQADDFLLFYAAEFNKNKNQKLLLQMMALIKDEIPNAKLLLAGEGPLMESCRQLTKDLGISHMVDFLGFRKDIDQILPMCDVAVGSSFREGLPVNIMEAMACGLPVAAIDNRGHRELISNNHNGWIITNSDVVEFAYKVMKLSKRIDIGKRFGINGRNIVIEKYSIDKILQENKRMYQSITGKQEESIWAFQ